MLKISGGNPRVDVSAGVGGALADAETDVDNVVGSDYRD